MTEEMVAEIYAYSMFWGQIVSIVLSIVAFIFKAIAIYTMSKRAGLKKLYLAFIPFANWILVGKLIGKVILWGRPVKNMGVWLTIVSLLAFIVGIFYNFDVYVSIFAIVTQTLTGRAIESIVFNSAFFNQLYYNTGAIYSIIYVINAVLSLAKIFLEVNIIFSIFKKYRPDKAFFYGLISIFIEFMFGFLLFSVRNNKPMTYDEYLQQMARKRGFTGYYGENPYNRGGYGGQTYSQPKQKDENPFPEFDDNGDSSSTSDDDLFN